MGKTTIEWTATRHEDGRVTPGETWNPTTGCTKISAGCRECYAAVMHKRLQGMGQPKYSQPFKVLKTHEEELKRPFEWKKPRTIFVNSMSDLFHEDLPLEFIQRVFAVMNACSWHTFQVLTKRADVLERYAPSLTWTDNIWMGVSVENNRERHRIGHLVNTGAKVKFLSLEPLLEALPNLTLKGIDWVIVGGESARKPRPIRSEWVEDIRAQCQASGTAFFFKQWGGSNKKESGRLLNGRTYDEMPQPPNSNSKTE